MSPSLASRGRPPAAPGFIQFSSYVQRSGVTMKLSEIRDLLQCEVLTGENDLFLDVQQVVASDGMSEILAFAKSKELMITGLTNIQSIRTADIAGVSAVIYCRGKRPDKKVVEFARQKRIPVLLTKMVMFDICGILYNQGLKGVS
jgi:predicted transcriptional regulator